MGDGKDIEVNGKVIGESTRITLTVKTAIWIIGLVIALFGSAFTIAYFDVKSDVKTYKEKVDKEKEEFMNKVEESISLKLEKQRDKDEEFIKSIEEIRGNIRLLLDRTQNSRNDNVQGSNTINNNIPDNHVPTRSNH
jgi:uncharacterized membrane protein YgaE (UPF0421/DUF939 family)